MSQSGFNPFNPNSVVVPELFAGRATAVMDIAKKLGQLKHNMPASFFIHGERGIGKTALSKLIKSVSSAQVNELYNLNILSSYYSVESGQDLSSVLQSSVNSLTDQMDSGLIKEIGGRLGELFKNGKFTIGAFGVTLGAETGERDSVKDITIKDQTVSILSNILQAAKDSHEKDGILIIIDEVHNLKDLQGAASVFRNISTTLDVSGIGQVSFLLIGYDEDIEKFFSEDSSSRRMFDLHALGVMPDEDAINLLIKGFESAEIEYDKDALAINTPVAGGYPHSLQVLGHNLIDVDSDGKINSDDWIEAITRTAHDLQNKEFSKLYSFGKPLTNKDLVLQHMAISSDDLTRKDFVEKLEIANVYQEISTLKKTGAIKEDHNKKTLSLHSQLFRTAILFDMYVRERQDKK